MSAWMKAGCLDKGWNNPHNLSKEELKEFDHFNILYVFVIIKQRRMKANSARHIDFFVKFLLVSFRKASYYEYYWCDRISNCDCFKYILKFAATFFLFEFLTTMTQMLKKFELPDL